MNRTTHPSPTRRRWGRALTAGAVSVLAVAGIAGPAVAAPPGTTVHLSKPGLGGTNGHTFTHMVSDDGQYVTFQSAATNLLPTPSKPNQVYVRSASGTERVSVSDKGVEANSFRSTPLAISATGRFVVFESLADNLVPDDSNDHGDVFVRDRLKKTTRRVSLTSKGEQVVALGIEDGMARMQADITPDGRFVVFNEWQSNLHPDPLNEAGHVYVRDTVLGTTTLVDLDQNGIPSWQNSSEPQISDDGTKVMFTTRGTLVGLNDYMNVFVRDLTAKTTTLVSPALGNELPDGNSVGTTISADGTKVLFTSEATNLVTGDTNGVKDAYVHHLATAKTTRVSLTSLGKQLNKAVQEARMSADGTTLVFRTRSSGVLGAFQLGCYCAYRRGIELNGPVTAFAAWTSTGEAVKNLSLDDDLDWEALMGVYRTIDVSGNGKVVTFVARDGVTAGDANGSVDLFSRVS